ncbi:MAG TPA: serine/threonine-protein kinase [Roseiflexaceae bacterium]|nr:serine/threonine-protein kinase [Roseiflexaceae bacterium]
MVKQLIGTRLGGYDIRALLGSGGMADVYRGYDPALDREVAIKVISTAGQPADFVSRFQREARFAARLRHPNIVQIYHFGGQQDIVYMVQELLPGPTLDRRMREAGRRRLPGQRVVAIVEQLAGALDFAHGQGVIHRDIKPSNALYNAQGQLVLTDFGIARNVADRAQATTGPGVVMGTPGYVAPEQAISSAALTPACDVYALGVLLFELLTGRLPFEADTPMGVILKHLYDEPPRPSSLRADLPSALDGVVLRALQKEPADRFPSAGALVQALRAAWPFERPATPRSAPPVARVAPKNAAPTTARPKAVPSSAPKPAAPAPSAAKRVTPKPATPKSAPTAVRAPAARPAAKPVASRARPVGLTATAIAPPSPRRLWRLRVGLLTIALVGALLLFGRYPNALGTAWDAALRLIGL